MSDRFRRAWKILTYKREYRELIEKMED